MKIFNKVAIVGIGLIGGSIALALKKKGLAREVVGVSRKQKSLLLAKRKGAIDEGSQSLEIVKDADLLILATPVNTIIKFAALVSKLVNKDCMVTDVGSTKQEIVVKLQRLFPNYVGSHPLAGTEKQSISNADSKLFENSLCILTPTTQTKPYALEKIKLLWNKLGVNTVLMSPKEHDKILSFVSHLPHIIAFSIMDIIPSKYLKFAASGFKDTTRIASSAAELWTDIMFTNRKNMIYSIELLQKSLSRIKSAIKTKDKDFLTRKLKKAKQKRDSID